MKVRAVFANPSKGNLSDHFRSTGASIINIRKFWEKILLAARAIVAVENPADVCAISCQPQGRMSIFAIEGVLSALWTS